MWGKHELEQGAQHGGGGVGEHGWVRAGHGLEWRGRGGGGGFGAYAQ